MAQPLPPARAPANTAREHVLRTLVLAWPVIISRVGMIGFLTVDVIVLGRAGADELARYILGLSLSDSLMASMAGLLAGVTVITARETGAGRDGAVGQVFRRGVAFGALIALAAALVLQWAEPMYLALGQSTELARSAAPVTAMVAWALPFWAIMFACTMFLEALHRPLIGTYAVILANVANLGLNILLVFGWGPIPAMGAVGTALSTVLVGAAMAIGMMLYIRFMLPGRARYGIGAPGDTPPPVSEQTKIGLFTGLSYLLEAGSFVAMTIMIGWLGTLALATFGVSFQILGLGFMVAFGLAAATQVRVGNAWGREDPKGMAMAGWTGLGLAASFCLLVGLLAVLAPGAVLGIYTNDPALIAAATGILFWVGLALTFDGSQTVMNHACRGRGDTVVPTALHFCSYWLIMVPLAYLIAIHWEGGVTGVFQSIFIASVFSFAVLALRFRALARRV
ncbi:MAG: MATE family efflux transporter [Pseudomonadota bacterium]